MVSIRLFERFNVVRLRDEGLSVEAGLVVCSEYISCKGYLLLEVRIVKTNESLDSIWDQSVHLRARLRNWGE